MTTEDFEYRLKHTHRNDPCPCGSGKKYKKCHLQEDEAAQHAALKEAAEQAQDNAKESETGKTSPGAGSTFVPKKRESRSHLKDQKSKGGRPITLPRRAGKA